MDKILEFIGLLRGSGIRIAVSEVLDAYKALCKIQIVDKDVFRNVLQCTLVKTSEDIDKFNKIFDLYFVVIDKEEKIDNNEFNDIVDDLKNKLNEFNLEDNNQNEADSNYNDKLSNGGNNEDKFERNDNIDNKSDDICNNDGDSGSSSDISSNVSTNDDMSGISNDSTSTVNSGNAINPGSGINNTYNENNNNCGNCVDSDDTNTGQNGKETAEVTDTLSNINKDFSNAFDMNQKETSIQDISEIYKYGSDAELKMKAEELANIQFDISDKNNIKGTAERLLIKNKLEFAKAVAKRNSSQKSQDNIDKKYNELKNLLKDAIEKNLVQQFGTDIISELTSEDTLCDSDLANLEYNDLDKVNAIIKKMVKKLKTNVSRKLQIGKKGKIDIRQTIKKSMKSGNVCSDLVFKRKRLDKSKLIVLCDISGSVCIYVPFMLQFVIWTKLTQL